jgi:hypothetical protein
MLSFRVDRMFDAFVPDSSNVTRYNGRKRMVPKEQNLKQINKFSVLTILE